MRIYRVTGADREGGAERIRKALRAHFGDDTAVEVDFARGEVQIGGSADPQIVTFLLDGAGFPVQAVEG